LKAATTFYPLWGKVVCDEQAANLVSKILPKIDERRNRRQFQTISYNLPVDAPQFASGLSTHMPHQMLLWKVYNYG
jgi:hypothetical protein